MDEKVYSLKREIFFDINPEGIFILNPSGETLILDDQVAIVIWGELTEKLTVKINYLVELLLEKFNIEAPSSGQVKDDVTRFLGELQDYDLVEERMI